MPDSIALIVNGKEINNFLSYEVDADMWQSACAFALELANPEAALRAGDECRLVVNGMNELKGRIDAVEKDTDKNNRSLKVYGRDMMGLVVDEYCRSAAAFIKKDIRAAAEAMLSQIPGVDLKAVRYEKGVIMATRNQLAQKLDVGAIGQTVFASLKSAAAQFGLMFFCLPDGTFCFGLPAAAPRGAVDFALVFRRSGQGNNVLRAKARDDISKRYKTIELRYQLPLAGNEGQAPEVITSPVASVTDPDYPSYAPQKTYVMEDSGEEAVMKARALMVINAQRHEALKLEYTVPGHSHKGKNWTINAFCDVYDDVNKYYGNYLITGRTFKLSKSDGTITKLRLGLPGVRA